MRKLKRGKRASHHTPDLEGVVQKRQNLGQGGLFGADSGAGWRPVLTSAQMPLWRTTVASKFAQYYNVSALTPPPDINQPVATASEHLARVVKILPASEVNEAYMKETGFRFPTLIPQGLLRLAAPAETFTPAFVAQQIGTTN